MGPKMTWTWERFAGQYIIRRVDKTKAVALEAPRNNRNNAAVHGLCEWLDEMEADRDALRVIWHVGDGPEAGVRVLVTQDFGDGHPFVREAWLRPFLMRGWWTPEPGMTELKHVVAWTPLPMPASMPPEGSLT